MRHFMHLTDSILLSEYCLRHGISSDDMVQGSNIVLKPKDSQPLARHLNVIVPASFAETDGFCAASCYPEVYDAFSAHLHTFRQDLCSDAALSALHSILTPYLLKWGYKPSPFFARWAASCLLLSPDNVAAEHILPQTRCLTPDAIPKNSLVSMKLSDCAARGAYVIFADDVPDTACCIASINRRFQGDTCVEIGVECAPAYRRRGYACSCVCALARACLLRGEAVLYQYYCTNRASAAVARRAGFELKGRFFAYSSYLR